MPPTGIKKQKTFGHRRLQVKPKPRHMLGSEQEKRQSSLTQLDFISTPRASSGVISIPSDNEEDGDFAVEQSRKRRRVSGKDSDEDAWTPRTTRKSSVKRQSARSTGRKSLEKGQQTMTQIDFVPSAQSHRIDNDEIDDDYFRVQDSGDEARDTPVLETKRQRHPNRANDEASRKSPSKDTHSPVKQSRRKSTRKASQPPPDLASHSIAAQDFTTPKKLRRHLEIPSSQSPPSIKLSVNRSLMSERRFNPMKPISKDEEAQQRSPLKEKSANIAPQRWQPETQESQNPTMKMLQQVRMRTMMGKAPLHEEPPMPPPKTRPQRAVQVQVESSQANQSQITKGRSPRKLKRTATVQDSQASDENIQTQAPPPKLFRTTTVQDSQHEDLDLSSQLYRSLSSRENLAESQFFDNDYNDENEYNEEDDYPHTYDPVSAALDRDAARYAWTQTQAPRTQHTGRTQIADSEAEESDDDDLDRGIVPVSDGEEDDIVLLPNPTDFKGPSQELPSDDFAGPAHPTEAIANEPEPRQQERTIVPNSSASPPSSPPPLRTSQVSTVVPTQSSPHSHAHRTEGTEADADEEEMSPPTSPPTANGKTRPGTLLNFQHNTQALTISSSPLPLPPWSSSGEMAEGNHVPQQHSKGGSMGKHYGSGELQSLADFSLPPPPSMVFGRSSSPWR